MDADVFHRIEGAPVGSGQRGFHQAGQRLLGDALLLLDLVERFEEVRLQHQCRDRSTASRADTISTSWIATVLRCFPSPSWSSIMSSETAVSRPSATCSLSPTRQRTLARRPMKRRYSSRLRSGRSAPGEETSSSYRVGNGSAWSSRALSDLLTRSQSSSVTASGRSIRTRSVVEAPLPATARSYSS